MDYEDRDRRRWKRRYPVDGGEPIKCSGRHCGGCTGEVVADCVAVCCCPCCFLNLLMLAFIKAPWKLGRRCFGSVRNKRKIVNMKREVSGKSRCEQGELSGGVDCSFLKGGLEEEIFKFFKGFCEEEDFWSSSAGIEAEKDWLELHQLGHVGFGRVSSAEIPRSLYFIVEGSSIEETD